MLLRGLYWPRSTLYWPEALFPNILDELFIKECDYIREKRGTVFYSA